MIEPRTLARDFARNIGIITMQVEGLSHADSLIQTRYNLNSLNWVLGHLADSRENVLQALGAATVTDGNELARYRRESDPIHEDGPGVVSFERLIGILEAGRDRVTEAIEAVEPDQWRAKSEVGDRLVSLGSRIHFLYFHDTYHTGQTELLRQLAGTNDKVI
ncbi:MAG: DinB family protein [Acidimicrobiia bacterium]|nr:DinB family protein [Acidimicrobiia bacterium]